MNYSKMLFIISLLLIMQTKQARFIMVGTGKSIQGSRPYQQDCFHLAQNSKETLLALICDGHGDQGDIVSKNVKEQLIEKINKTMFSSDIKENISTIKTIFAQVNDFLRKNSKKESFSSGTTCVACLHIDDNFYIANVGDSRAVWGIKKEEQTIDHTGKNKKEVYRVGQHNIKGPQDRLGGILMVTRAFGDLELVKNKLSAEPDVFVLPIQKTPFIILGCDGVWDGSSTKYSPLSEQNDNNSLIYRLMYHTIVTQKESVEIACKRIMTAAICSTLEDRTTPLQNLFDMCKKESTTPLLVSKIGHVTFDNAITKLDPYKEDMILSLSLNQLNYFIKENKEYAHDNTTVICLYNQEANIAELATQNNQLTIWDKIKIWLGIA